jgi:hypothetical protein
MRILVAILAGVERDILVLNNHLRVFGSAAMALIACHFFMQPRQRVARLLVIEPGGRLPAVQRVAAPALGAQLAPMDIFVAGGARLAGKPEISAIQVFYPNARVLALQNMRRGVTPVAR